MCNWIIKYISACMQTWHLCVVPKSDIADLMKLFDHSIVALVLSDNVLCLLLSDNHGVEISRAELARSHVLLIKLRELVPRN
jgi:hypothetical protein